MRYRVRTLQRIRVVVLESFGGKIAFRTIEGYLPVLTMKIKNHSLGVTKLFHNGEVSFDAGVYKLSFLIDNYCVTGEINLSKE